MTARNEEEGSGSRLQLKVVLLIFGALTGLLAIAYLLFMRPAYTVIYTDLRAADAAAIVAELDRQSVSYQLRDGGSTILVPEERASSVRLAIAGSDLPLQGIVGFELFNESDMGLTDFAQKVNYQRALQGELARTVMMMEGVESARVHLAIPERALFRGSRSDPKAAVTVTAKRGSAIDPARVAGIQRLVAAAVTDLVLDEVVVLDEVGRVISRDRQPSMELIEPVGEQTALQQYFRARAHTAAARILPAREFDVQVTAVPRGMSQLDPGEAGGQARDFALRVIFLTSAPLEPSTQEAVRDAVAEAVELSASSGDSFAFALGGAYSREPQPKSGWVESSPRDSLERGESGSVGAPTRWWDAPWAALAALIGLVALIGLGRFSAPRLAPAQREAMIARIRQHLSRTDGGHDVAL